MKATTAQKTDLKDTTQTSFGATLLVITFRVAFILTLLVVIAIAAWAGLALFGGLVSAGDPLTLIAEWFNAVTGR
ncbi:MAG: hypothetical protein C0618_09805 [Desulfuromonas sp.]|nr:MAG: hypothetical protein C0618_09805 [Desulfuromonas sp.]